MELDRDRDHMNTKFEHSSTPAIETQDPTPDGLKEVITGLPLIRYPNLMNDEYCRRCERKNRVRRRYSIPERDPTFDDGERVTLICGYTGDPDETRGWEIRAVHHADHPVKNLDDVDEPGQALAVVTARLDRDGWTYMHPVLTEGEDPEEYHVEDRSVVRDVEVDQFSAIDPDHEPNVSDERDESDMVELKPTDPRPDWPDEENAWRREVMEEHDDWNDETSTGKLDLPPGTPSPDYPDGPSI